MLCSYVCVLNVQSVYVGIQSSNMNPSESGDNWAAVDSSGTGDNRYRTAGEEQQDSWHWGGGTCTASGFKEAAIRCYGFRRQRSQRMLNRRQAPFTQISLITAVHRSQRIYGKPVSHELQSLHCQRDNGYPPGGGGGDFSPPTVWLGVLECCVCTCVCTCVCRAIGFHCNRSSNSLERFQSVLAYDAASQRGRDVAVVLFCTRPRCQRAGKVVGWLVCSQMATDWERETEPETGHREESRQKTQRLIRNVTDSLDGLWLHGQTPALDPH